MRHDSGMGKTSADKVVRVLTSGLAQRCRDEAELAAAALRGEPKKGECPFTGMEIEVPMAPEIQRLAKEVAARGLGKDAAFVDAMRDALLAARRAGMFDFFAALDGEGELPDGMQLVLSTHDGVQLNGTLHERFAAS